MNHFIRNKRKPGLHSQEQMIARQAPFADFRCLSNQSEPLMTSCFLPHVEPLFLPIKPTMKL